MKRRILFLTGTRADFGKLKTLIKSVDGSPEFEVAVFITGMHTSQRYGYTVDEVYRALPEHRLQDGARSVYVFHNQVNGEPMERVLANTIDGLSRYVTEFRPDLIVVHGDRVEAMAGAIVGSLRNILVAHIEGGEVSGTIDELIRHAVSKMSHAHFVANELAQKRLIQLGEFPESVNIIGSPDVDLMMSPDLPDLDEVKRYYEIPFDNYGIVLLHPVTTNLDDTKATATALVDCLLETKRDYVVIYPNNDAGCELIFEEYKRLENDPHCKIIPSMRMEYFLTLLKEARFMVGNSSAGIRECPVFGIHAINVSLRQTGRASANCVTHVSSDKQAIYSALVSAWEQEYNYDPDHHYGAGNSAELFLSTISNDKFWQISTQKLFQDI